MAGIVQARLDYWLIPQRMIYQNVDSEIRNSMYSDHNIIVVRMRIGNRPKPGRGIWKFNSSLLKEKEYVGKINDFLEECKDKYKFVDAQLAWDCIKIEMWGITISHSVYKARQRRKEESELEAELGKAELKLEINPIENNLQYYNTSKR